MIAIILALGIESRILDVACETPPWTVRCRQFIEWKKVHGKANALSDHCESAKQKAVDVIGEDAIDDTGLVQVCELSLRLARSLPRPGRVMNCGSKS